MHAQDFVINQSTNWQAIENILKLFPNSDAVASLALIVETIDSVYLSTLMVPSEQEEILLELNFVG